MTRSSARPVAAILSALLLCAALVPVLASPVAAATGSTELIAAANAERTKAGLRTVSSHLVLNAIAAERAAHMVRDRKLSHDFDYIKMRFGEERVCWQQFGEILAWNFPNDAGQPEASRFMEQWIKSDGHRKIMLGSGYTTAGAAWAKGKTEDGKWDVWYGVMIFLKPCDGAAAPSSGTSFTDTASSPFRGDVEWLVAKGITSGCSTTRFCPDAPVTRGQMASFLVRALSLPTSSRDYFWDDASSLHQGDINRLAASGISGGCGGGRFCPNAPVSRAEMASFLSRAKGLDPATRDFFSDDRGLIHEQNINRMAQASITGGCDASRYCPSGAVTRGQMAAFLRRAFGS